MILNGNILRLSLIHIYKKHCDDLMQENEALRMRLAEIRERINGMELPHEYHILYNLSLIHI